MGNHSVIEHRANYHFLKVEEDFLAICSFGEDSPHCKAMILAILEHWTNTKRDTDQGEYTYLSLPEWVEQTYECYARNVIINCLKELLDANLIERRPIVRYDQDTFEYKLNIDAIQARIRALPEKAPKDVKPNLAAYRELHEQKRIKREEERKAKEGSLKINDGVVDKSTPLKSKRGVVDKSTKGSLKRDDGSLKSKRNIDTILTSSPTSVPRVLPAAADDANASHPLVTEPDMTCSWIAEYAVQYAEYRNGASYRETERKRQLEASRAIHRDDPAITLLQFQQAYDERNDDWWQTNQGKLHVTHMRGKEKNSGMDRLHSMLDRLAAKKKPRGKPAPVREVPPVSEEEQQAKLQRAQAALALLQASAVGTGVRA